MNSQNHRGGSKGVRHKPSGSRRHENGGAASQQQQGEHHHHLNFLSALATVPVLPKLLNGVQIYTVAASGKTQPAVLTLSRDRFTAFIDDRKDKNDNSTSSSVGTMSTGGGSGMFGLFRDKSNNPLKRAIDIGEMDRVQRGQSTQQFEFAKKHVITKANNFEVVLHKAELKRNPSASSNSSAAQTLAAIQQLDPSLSFSIIFRGAHTVDLMAITEHERDEICDTLDEILTSYQRVKKRVSTDLQLLRYIWLDVDKDKLGYITVQQIGKVLQAINFNMKQKDVISAYDKFGKIFPLRRVRNRKVLSFDQSATFLHKIKRDSWMVKPVNVLWNELFGEIMKNQSTRMTVSDKTFLEKFLHGKQKQTNLSLYDVRAIFKRLHAMEYSHTRPDASVDLNRINKDQFEAYLLAEENDAFSPERAKFRKKNMDRPLSEYYINSSHNTYLIGDQYKSASSVQMYSNALYRGARCLELDIWDGPKSSSGTPIPVVWHGGTLTPKINFVDIIKTIKVFLNFHPDTYPIILSFENHCSIPYQELMAEQLTNILGDSLYVPTEASLFGPLPSPNKLRGMVVIKGRRPDGTEADQYDSEDEESDTEEGTNSSSLGDFAGDIQAAQAARQRVVKHGVAPELASLTLFHGHKLKSFDESHRTPNYYMHSFSESKVRSKCRHKQSMKWMVYNQTHMSRTYPAGSRLDSSNYNPLLAWSTGCQMVALNFQTQDSFLRLNDGKFRENGNCGYVPKPSSLMVKEDLGQTAGAVKLTIRVLSGSCLPKAKGLRSGDFIDPYVRVAVYDVKNDEKDTFTQCATGVVTQNGFFPIWSQEKFTFSVDNWAVAMLQVTVLDKLKEEFIASSSVPICCLRRGIRCVKLYDATNTRSGAFAFASLLLDIKIGQMVAEI